VRNCLFAGNQVSNGSKGWGVRATVDEKGTVGSDGSDEVLTLDHCTFAKNINNSNSSTYPRFLHFSKAPIPQHVFFKGCTFWENRYRKDDSFKLAYVSDDHFDNEVDVAKYNKTFTHCYADVINRAFTVTEENGNLGPDAGDVKFVNPDNLDFRLNPGSCLINKGGAFADWMGTGRKNSVHDMGAGYIIGTLGNYGVTVGRRESNPRRCGTASDIGCCELWWPKGTVMSVR
jgi:hypothetical protein